MQIIFLLILVLVILGLLLYLNRNSESITKQGTFEGGFDTPLNTYKTDNILGTFKTNKGKSKKNKSLAKRLTDAGWKLYTKDSCPWCHLQVDLFGNDKQYLHIIDCTNSSPDPKDLANCRQVWVYPTWVNGDKILPGTQSFSTLNNALNGKFYTTKDITKKTYNKILEKQSGVVGL